MRFLFFLLKFIFFLIIKIIIYNKYSLIFSLFLIWMFFFDTHSFLIHYKLNKQIRNFEEQNCILHKKINKSKSKYVLLRDNKFEKERYARENYFMKKKNEDIIIITYKEDSIKK